jgi:ATP-dependent RNA helicase DeaD
MDLMERKSLDVSAVDWFILDEADEMLDMGFFEDVEKILAAVKDGGDASSRTSLHIALFSATMPEPILKVVRRHIGDAEIIVDSAPEDEKPLVDQYCILVRREDKLEALRRIIDSSDEFYGLIFCATKVETDELARRLVEAGYPAEAIHGDLSQEIRERTLRRFRLRQHGSRHHAASSVSAGGEPAILVATDVAARGLDIENLSHVINWDLPNDRETYVHRIGRTARAGKRGIAISLAGLSDRSRIHQISRMMEKTLGSGILWLKVPSVKAVMKALRRRISSTVIAALPEQETVQAAENVEPLSDAATPPLKTEAAEAKENTEASPFLAKVCRNLIERLGAEKAVEALVSLSYGEYLDPGRYGPITEFQEEDFREPAKAAGKSASGRSAGRRRDDRVRRPSGPHAPAGKRGFGREFREETGDFTRVYIGQGRQHGFGARDIANLLMRAGGVPGRLVDEIEMKDYCSFATLPADAAKRACAFSRKDQQSPVIRPAKP